MRIVYLTNGNINSNAAYVVNIANMCNAFGRLGHEVHLVVPNYKDDFDQETFLKKLNIKFPFQIHRVSVIRLPFLRTLSFFINSIITTRKLRPNINFVRFHDDFFYVPFLKGDIFIERHLPLDTSSWKRFIQLKCYKKYYLKKLIVITKVLKGMYDRDCPEISEKVLVAPDAANLSDEEREIPIKGDKSQNIGYVGHLYDGRGIEIVLGLAEQNPNLGFHLVGGNETDVKRWKTRSAQLKNVFFYGFLPHAEIASIGKSFDVLLAPYQKKVSVKGGGKTNTVKWMSPLKIFEYMSFRKPFIASDISVLKEVLEHERNCLLSPPEDIDVWNKCIHRLLSDPELYENLKENAYSDLKQNYTWYGRCKNILRAKGIEELESLVTS